MAVLEVNKMWSRSGFDARTEDDLRSSGGIVEGWQIVTDPDTSNLDIAASPLLPQRGTRYPGLQHIFLKQRSFDQISPIYWIGRMQYEGEFGPGGANDSAISSPPRIEWSDIEYDEPIDQDVDGNSIQTVNREPIEGVTMKIADLVLTVERNFLTFSPSLTHQYRHSVSSDTFQGFAAGTARMIKFSAKAAWRESNFGYWRVSASIQFRYPYNTTAEKAWYARTRHEGFYELVRGEFTPGVTSNKIMRAVDENKEPVVRPVLLGLDGFRTTEAKWLEWKRYHPMPYNALGLI